MKRDYTIYYHKNNKTYIYVDVVGETPEGLLSSLAEHLKKYKFIDARIYRHSEKKSIIKRWFKL